uniref:Mitochondrial inner membrane protein OXA1L-like n=1 Tax=Phallusia mammillata TaxID=59560 RepID=A0A6F9DNN8_9ASCI|nr:mitochondrial inner membrane protein OXA1L-like [Phallusia mammillata]
MLHFRAGQLAALQLRTRICNQCFGIIRTQPNGFRPTKSLQITSLRTLSLSSKHYSNVEPVVAAAKSVPPISDVTTTLSDISGSIVDPPFSELGLAAGWYPYHWIQSGLEMFYVNTGCPWWLTIIAGTCIVRLVTLPIYISTRKFLISMRNNMPMQQKLLERLREAKANGTAIQRMKAAQKLRDHMKTSGTGPIKSMFVNIPMPVLFISMIMAYRQMMTVPVPSLQATEFLWLQSLCSPDPYYVLPVLVGALTGLAIKLQMQQGMMAVPSATLQKFMGVAPFLPMVAVPLFIGHWPSGISLYMLINTVFTLSFVQLLSSEKVKEKLNFPVLSEVTKEKTSITSVWKDFYTDAKDKAAKKQEASELKSMEKKRAKARKKELKGPPPVTYAIGTEAIKKEHVPDFIAMWDSKPVNIYSRKKSSKQD